MSKQSAITTIARYRITLPTQYLQLLDRTDDPVKIGDTRYARYTWRGVPGRLCDVIIGESVLRHAADESVVIEISDMRPHRLPPAIQDVVLEIGDKAGKYDGAIRRRYAIRQFPRAALETMTRADLRVQQIRNADDSGDELMVIVRPHDQPSSGWLTDIFPRMRADLHNYELNKIIMWHWTRYYRHIPHDEAEALSVSWPAEIAGQVSGWTLAEANRAASRALYRLSVDLGWRKLTEDEKVRLELPVDTGQWQHERTLMPIYQRLGSPTGVGQATLRAAAGGTFTGEADIEFSDLSELLSAQLDERGQVPRRRPAWAPSQRVA